MWWLPSPHQLAGSLGVTATALLMTGLGGLAGASRQRPEIRLLAGWGLACLVLTAWGTASGADMRPPLIVLAFGGALGLLKPAASGGYGGVAGILGLTVPLWLVVLPMQPSQIDTWLNLLPNAAYLFDHNQFPTEARAPSHSFLPVAPYNTQFVAYAASVLSGSFAESALAWFNVLLNVAAGLLLARALAGQGSHRPSPPQLAAGFLLAVPLNPGFVPRVFFASYGEAPLAVTGLAAVWLAADALDRLGRREGAIGSIATLGLVLAAMVNIKQSGLGLVLPIGAAMGVLVLRHRNIPLARGMAATLAAIAPALILWAIWRPFATTSFVEGELKVMPMAAWNWPNLPGILAATAHAIWQKATYFIVLTVALALGWNSLLRGRSDRDGLILDMTAIVIPLFCLFILFTYIAHFPSDWALRAHSFFRYASQLSLIIMLALVVAFRPQLTRLLAPTGVARVAVALTVALPLLAIGMLRFDRDAPQPALRALAEVTAARLPEDARLSLILPGDTDDSVGSFLRGELLFTPPRRARLDIDVATGEVDAGLRSALQRHADWALVSCTPAGFGLAPDGVAALLQREGETWQTVATWPYRPDLKDRNFSAMLARGPVCAARRSAADQP